MASTFEESTPWQSDDFSFSTLDEALGSDVRMNKGPYNPLARTSECGVASRDVLSKIPQPRHYNLFTKLVKEENAFVVRWGTDANQLHNRKSFSLKRYGTMAEQLASDFREYIIYHQHNLSSILKNVKDAGFEARSSDSGESSSCRTLASSFQEVQPVELETQLETKQVQLSHQTGKNYRR